MGGQPAFLLSEYGFGRRRQAVFYKMVSDGKQERRDLCIFVTTIMKRGKI